MTRGRKPEGVGLIERLAGSEAAKTRLELILEALAGRRTVAEVCRQLGLGERRFHALRQQVLQAALGSLEPRPAGRPAQTPSAADGRVAALEAAVQELRLDLRAAQIREEIALALPHLLQRAAQTKKAGRLPHRCRPTGPRAAPGGSRFSARAAPAAPADRGGAALPASANPATGNVACAPAPSPSAAGPVGGA
jgi:hypothetical protein